MKMTKILKAAFVVAALAVSAVSGLATDFTGDKAQACNRPDCG